MERKRKRERERDLGSKPKAERIWSSYRLQCRSSMLGRHSRPRQKLGPAEVEDLLLLPTGPWASFHLAFLQTHLFELRLCRGPRKMKMETTLFYF